MTHTANPAQIREFLQGVDYPAGKQALVSAAKDQGVDANVVRAVEGIPDRTYDAPTDVSEAIVRAGQHPEGGSTHAGVPSGDTDDDAERGGERFDAG